MNMIVTDDAIGGAIKEIEAKTAQCQLLQAALWVAAENVRRLIDRMGLCPPVDYDNMCYRLSGDPVCDEDCKRFLAWQIKSKELFGSALPGCTLHVIEDWVDRAAEIIKNNPKDPFLYWVAKDEWAKEQMCKLAKGKE